KNGPAAPNLSNDRGVSGSQAALVKRRTIFGRQPLGLDNIFHSERDSPQRSVPGWLLRMHLDPGVNRRLEFSDALQTLFQSLLPFSPIRLQPIAECFQARRFGDN